MNKTSQAGIVGALMIVFGAILFGLFMLSNECFYYFSNLAPYTIGFLITGLIASIFGFLLTLTSLDRLTADAKTDNRTKSRVVLIMVSILYLILIGYIVTIDNEWTIRPLIIGDFAFYYEFTLSSYSAFFATLLAFGIVVLPFAIAETGFLDDTPDEKAEKPEVKGDKLNGAEQSFDRFILYMKKRFSSIRKLRNYTLPVAVTCIIIGGCLAGLPYFMIFDGPLTWDPEVEVWFIKDYKGYIRGQLLLMGILLIVIGIVLMLLFRKSKKQKGQPTLQ